MTLKKAFLVGVPAIALLATLMLLMTSSPAREAEAATTLSLPTGPKDYYQAHTFFEATTTSAVSTNAANPADRIFRIAGAKNVNLLFSRGGVVQPNTGSTLFDIDVTTDGVTWVDYNMLRLIDVTSTSAAYDTRVGTSTVSGTSTKMYNMDVTGFYGIRCTATETTDGEHTCKATAEF